MFSLAVGAARRGAPALARRSSLGARFGAVQRRGMAGHGELYISKNHTMVGQIYFTIMFTWMGYRAYQDGAVLLCLEHPWDHMDHGHGHGGKTYKYRTSEENGMPELVEDDDEEAAEDEE